MFKRLVSAVARRSSDSQPTSDKQSNKGRQKTPPKSSKPNQNRGRKKVDHDKKVQAKSGRKKKTNNRGSKNNSVQSPAESWDISQFVVAPEPDKTRFHDLDLPDSVMQGIHALGFSYCTPIQAESLPAALRGRDTIGQAQTGTGKSAAFLLTILNRLLTVVPEQRYASEPRALIVAPTRELALQIGKDAEGLARFTGLNIATVVGGMNYEEQRRQLRDEVVDILVAILYINLIKRECY